MPYTEQIMVAEGNEESPGTDNVKLEDVSKSEGGTNLDSLSDSSNDINDSDLIVSKEDDTNWVKKTASKVWDYIKSKLDIGTTADGTYLNKAGQWSTPPDTTYNVVSKSADGLAPQLPDETTTTKYLRQDGAWEIPPDNNTWPNDATYKSKMLDFCYPVGSIYVSTKNVSPATFLGGTWISLSGYMLRGATSGVTANSNAKDGGADTVTLTGAQSGIQKHSHGFTQPTVNGGATNTGGMSANNPHSHSSRAAWHNGGASGTTLYGINWATNASAMFTTNGNLTSGNQSGVSVQNTNIAHTHSQVAHTHSVSGGAVSEKAATNATSSFSNIPNYKNVYMWERTA